MSEEDAATPVASDSVAEEKKEDKSPAEEAAATKDEPVESTTTTPVATESSETVANDEEKQVKKDDEKKDEGSTPTEAEPAAKPSEESNAKDEGEEQNDDDAPPPAATSTEASMDEAVEGAAAAEASATTEEEAASPQEKDDLKKVTKAMHQTKVDGGKKSVWAMTMETLQMADGGKAKNTDIRAATEEEGLQKLKDILAKNKDKHPKFQFLHTPFTEFNATEDDLLLAFVRWSKKEEGDKEEKGSAPNMDYNVTKAFRRVDGYATWMEHNKFVFKEPLTPESIRNAAKEWQFRLTHDNQDRLVWWVDFHRMNLRHIKDKLPVKDSLRYVVWMSHMVLFDQRAQKNGVIFAQAMARKGVFEVFTMLPMDVATKLDRLTIGCLPIKAKVIYMIHCARWVHVMMRLMTPFLSKKMRQRIVFIKKKDDAQAILDNGIGRKNIPIEYAGMKGDVLNDLVFGRLTGVAPS